MSDRYPDFVASEETPEATLETVPDEIIRQAISIAVTYGACRECGEQQFIPIVPGHNSNHKCAECGFEMRVVG